MRMLNNHPTKFKRALKDFMREKRGEFMEAKLKKNKEECELLKATVAEMQAYWEEAKDMCASLEWKQSLRKFKTARIKNFKKLKVFNLLHIVVEERKY